MYAPPDTQRLSKMLTFEPLSPRVRQVRSGREYLIAGVCILLFFSFAQVLSSRLRNLSPPLPLASFLSSLFSSHAQWVWEFTKILTYQNRFFSRGQIQAISAASNLPMSVPDGRCCVTIALPS